MVTRETKFVTLLHQIIAIYNDYCCETGVFFLFLFFFKFEMVKTFYLLIVVYGGFDLWKFKIQELIYTNSLITHKDLITNYPSTRTLIAFIFGKKSTPKKIIYLSTNLQNFGCFWNEFKIMKIW